MSPPEVEARGLAVGYDGRPILEGLDFAVERGDIFALLGASGSGKSTVLKCLIGLLEPIAGDVRFRGEPPPPLEDRRPQWGTMFQGGALFGSLTVAENVALPLEQWTGLDAGAIDVIARARLRLVGLAGAEDLRPAELSGGRGPDGPGGLSRRFLEVLDDAKKKLEALDAKRFSERAFHALDEAGRAVAEFRAVVARLDELVVSSKIPETTGAVRSAAESVEGGARELTRVAGDARDLPAALRETLEAVRRLAALLERDPSALLRGRGPVPEGRK